MIRIGLSNGTVLTVNESAQTPPSKKQVRNKSGRQGRKTFNAQRTEQAVGGYRNLQRAIFAAPDKELCIVVSNDRKYTDSPGLNTRSAGGKATS